MMGFFKKKEVAPVKLVVTYIPKNNLTIQEIEDLWINGELYKWHPGIGKFVNTNDLYDGVQSMVKTLGSDIVVPNNSKLIKWQWYIITLIIKKIIQQKGKTK